MAAYKDAGVDLKLGDESSKILYEAARRTWKNREGDLGEVVELFPDFSGFRAVNIGGLPVGTYMNLSFDGVGTKIEAAERTMKHDAVAYDLFAMVCDDAVVRGAEPVLLGSILDVNSLDGNMEPLRQLAKGYINAAKKANVAVVNGEIAELGARVHGYGNFNYNWGAGIVWFAHKDRILTGKEIRVGDKLVALKEKGFRSNGLSLVRKIMEKEFGKEWHNVLWENKTLGEEILTPSVIYTRAVVDMFGGYNPERKPKTEIHGVVHITGGGIPGKLGRVLKSSRLGAIVESLKPPKIMDIVKNWGNVSDETAYETWNMGQGMIIIAPDPKRVIQIAVSHGIEAHSVGEIIKDKKILIKSNGHYSERKELVFEL